MSDDQQPDFGGLARRAWQLQGEVSNAKSDLVALQATGFGGGGLVTATVSGEGRLVGLQIDRSVIDPDDPETLAETVIAAVNNANETMAERRNERMTEVTDGLQSLLAGLDPGTAGGGRVVPRFAPRRLPGSPEGPASRRGGRAEGAAER
jgi:DNA-binding YbaB/EbfC family protein